MSEVYNCYNILDVENPVEIKPNTSAWAQDILKEAGWREGDKIPGKLNQFFSELLKIKKLPSKPNSLRELIQDPEVKLALSGALEAVRRKQYSTDYATQEVDEAFKNVDLSNPIAQQLRQTAIEAAKIRIEAENPQQSSNEDEEDLSDLDEDVTPEASKEEKKEHPGLCPCCHWDLSKEYIPLKLEEPDIKAFLISVLGGPAYTKTYSIWGGLCTATFHIIDAREQILFDEQYAKEYVAGKLDMSIVAQKTFDLYHVALSLSKLEFAVSLNKKAPTIPSIWSDSFTPTDTKTRLDRYVSEFYSKIVTTVEFQNELVEKWREFIVHTIRLQQELNNKDFWNGVTLG